MLSPSPNAAIGASAAKAQFVRDLIVGPARSESVVWEYLILILSLAALVKSAALQNAYRCTGEEKLRQQ